MSTLKYHISPETGRPNICRAHRRPCPVGGEGDHYPTKEEARAAYEKRMKPQASPQGLRKRNTQPPTPEEEALVWKAMEERGYEVHEKERAARSLLKGVEALKSLPSTGGKVCPLNGGGSWSATLGTLSRTASLDVDFQGTLYLRIADPASSHRDGAKSWRLPAPASAQALTRTLQAIVDEAEAAEKLKAARAARRRAQEREEMEARTAEARKQEVERLKALHPSLREAPPFKGTVQPLSMRETQGPGQGWAIICTSCGQDAETDDGYTECCNEPADHQNITGRSRKAYLFNNVQDLNNFARANQVEGYGVTWNENKKVELHCLEIDHKRWPVRSYLQ